MDRTITYVGLDVHKGTIAVALAETGGRKEWQDREPPTALTVAPRRRRLDRRDAIFQHDGMRRLLESQPASGLAFGLEKPEFEAVIRMVSDIV